MGIILTNGALLANSNHYLGVICGVCSAIMYAFMVIFNKKATNISGLENSLLQLTFSFLTVAVTTLFNGSCTFHIPEGSLLPLIFLGLVNTGLGCYLYFSRLDQLPIQSVSILGYLEPLSAVLLSVIILQESMSLPQIIGAVLILGGAIYAEVICQQRT